jgi:hypothetical protein
LPPATQRKPTSAGTAGSANTSVRASGVSGSAASATLASTPAAAVDPLPSAPGRKNSNRHAPATSPALGSKSVNTSAGTLNAHTSTSVGAPKFPDSTTL